MGAHLILRSLCPCHFGPPSASPLMALFVQYTELRDLLLAYLGGGYGSFPRAHVRTMLRARQLVNASIAFNTRPPAERMLAFVREAALQYRVAYEVQRMSLGSFVQRCTHLLETARAAAPARLRAVLQQLLDQVQEAMRACGVV